MTLYITSVSFEDRCLALASDIVASDETEKQVVVLDFSGYENVDPYLANRARIIQSLSNAMCSPRTLHVSLASPLDGKRQLEELINEVCPAKVVLDISTLPRNYLFTICHLLAESKIYTTIRYYKPDMYGSQLSRGVRRVQAIPGFEGDAVGFGVTILVLILGFEGYKSVYAWEQLGASKTVALIGDPPYRQDFLDIARRNNSELLGLLGDRADVRPLHTFDVVTAHNQLLQMYEELRRQHENVEITICPLGTKPQSLAAFAFAYHHPRVSVAYVSSLIYYTGDYSKGFNRDYVEVSLQSLLRREAESA